MSGLSLIMKGKGFRVQGSDLSLNKNNVSEMKDNSFHYVLIS